MSNHKGLGVFASIMAMVGSADASCKVTISDKIKVIQEIGTQMDAIEAESAKIAEEMQDTIQKYEEAVQKLHQEYLENVRHISAKQEALIQKRAILQDMATATIK